MVILAGGKQPSNQISDIIKDFVISQAPLGEVRKDEEWIASQLYGTLQGGLHDDFQVYLEYEIDPHRKHRVDVLVDSPPEEEDSVFAGKGPYLIELKMAENMGSVSQLVSQIRSYHTAGKINQRSRTYVVVLFSIDVEAVVESDSFQGKTPPQQIVDPEDDNILYTVENGPSPCRIREALDDLDRTEATFIGIQTEFETQQE